jgi:hypothetical protein
MAKPNPKVLLQKAGSYLKEHPEEIMRGLRGILGLRLGVPIDALRYLAREFGGGKKAPKDVVIEAAPPGIRVGATVDAMGTPLRAKATIFVEEVDVSTEKLTVAIRIADLSLDVLGDSSSPIGGLLKSGALDLSKPGNLVAFMPKRPAVLVDAKDDRLTFDLMKVPKIADNPRVKTAIEILSPILGVRTIATENDHLDVQLRADLAGVSAAFAAARSHL